MSDIELVISSRFKALLPALSDEEQSQLELNIEADGRVIDPILFWAKNGKNVIVDGMHRYPIAKRKGVPFTVKELEFENDADAELWILDHALGRRHLLNSLQISKIRGEMYNRTKGTSGGKGGSTPVLGASCQNDTTGVVSGGAARSVAERTGTSVSTVKRDGKFVAMLAKLSEPVRKAIEDGRLNVTDAELKSLSAKLSSEQQDIARQVRTGQSKSVSEAMGLKPQPNGKAPKAPKPECQTSESGKHAWESDGNGLRFCSDCKEDHPDNPKTAKRTKGGKEVITAAKLVDQLVRQHISPAVRLLDGIAKANGGKGEFFKAADEALETILQSLKKMRGGEK